MVISTHLYLLVLSVPERNMNGLITVKGIKKQANFMTLLKSLLRITFSLTFRASNNQSLKRNNNA